LSGYYCDCLEGETTMSIIEGSRKIPMNHTMIHFLSYLYLADTVLLPLSTLVLLKVLHYYTSRLQINKAVEATLVVSTTLMRGANPITISLRPLGLEQPDLLASTHTSVIPVPFPNEYLEGSLLVVWLALEQC